MNEIVNIELCYKLLHFINNINNKPNLSQYNIIL